MNPFEEELMKQQTGAKAENPFDAELKSRTGGSQKAQTGALPVVPTTDRDFGVLGHLLRFFSSPKEGIKREASGAMWPLSRFSDGSIRFDREAGFAADLNNGWNTVLDVTQGRLDPMSPEGHRRIFELAAIVSPGSRVGRLSVNSTRGIAIPTRVKPRPPTAEEHKNAAKAVYQQINEAGTQFSTKSVEDLSTAIQNEMLWKRGIGPEDAPRTIATLERLRNAPTGATVPYSTGLNAAQRQLFKRAAESPVNNLREPAASAYAARRIMDFLETPGGVDVVSGPVVPTNLLKQANANYAAGQRSEILTGHSGRAELLAAASHAQKNLGNGDRQRTAGLLANKDLAKDRVGFTDGELQALAKVVEGSAAAKLTRKTGDYLVGSNPVGQVLNSAIGGWLGAATGGLSGAPFGAALPKLLGHASKMTSNHLTKSALNKVDKATRMRSPLYQQRLAEPWPDFQVPPKLAIALGRAALIEASQQQRENLGHERTSKDTEKKSTPGPKDPYEQWLEDYYTI